MAYMALYRKYRPSVFEDVKGQDPIVTTLKNQIKADRIGHAYLFCGTRGTGKTTAAKIFAKAVNCEHPVDGSPCGECDCCKAIAAGTSMNVIEIDAASNNGVDSIRQIRDEVTYSPTQGRFKVYIIDEVHMLSTGAFNALLKTLEEPPEYVIFILATTEPHKIPVTVLSRCQRYDFRRISIDTISERLNELLKKEEIPAQESAVRYIARAADGSMRDALSLLDQCIAFYLGQELTYDNVLNVLGAADTEVFSRLLRRIIAGDTAGAVELLDELLLEGREPGQLVTDFIWYLRNLLLVRSADHMEEVLDMSSENVALLKEEARMLDSEVLMRYIRVFSELSGQLRYAAQKRVLIEIALIKLCHPAMETSPDALYDRVAHLEKELEEALASGIVLPKEQGERQETVPKKSSEPSKPKVLPEAVPEVVKTVARDWNKIVKELPGGQRTYLSSVKLSLNQDNSLLLVFSDPIGYEYIAEGYADQNSTKTRLEALSDFVSEKYQMKIAMTAVQNHSPDAAQDAKIDLIQVFSGAADLFENED